KSEKILEAIEKSRRCILLLSADYISNEWCRFEYLIAQHETCIKVKQRIIPIMLDDIDK
ncbi:toll-like receptor, partial [Plakobranchus ocellatus]